MSHGGAGAGPAPALALRGLSKHFGGVRALDDVALTVLPGEVHGLLGENGSGKSTLIKILAGFHAPDSGELEMSGRPVRLPLAPGQFRQLGISFVHQDLGLVPSLSAVENLRVGAIAASRSPLRISWRAERRRAAEAFARYGVRIHPRARIADLRPVQRALLAIVRAVEELREGGHAGGGLLVLDEPTVFLPRADVEQLFALVREVVAGGASVLFVSHDIDEVHEVTDRVTVLRDGRVVGTLATAAAAEGQVVEMIVGRRLAAFEAEHHDVTARTPDVRVRGLTGAGVAGIDLDLHDGEVVGLTGLAGSGFEAVPYLLVGAWRARAGRLSMDGREIDLAAMGPHRAGRAGIALVPGDRQRDGSVGSLSVADNVMLPSLADFGSLLLRRRALGRRAAGLLTDYDVRPNDPGLRYGALSGGNQQRVMMAKWLHRAPRLLLLHEPTQGVDVGARQHIFTTVRAAAERGMAVLCASSDHEQLAAICDRVLVLARGRIARALVGDGVTKDRILESCYAATGSAA